MIESLPIKHHSLTGRISVTLMHDAFRAVRRNKGKAGVEGGQHREVRATS